MAWSQAPGKDFADVNPTLLALLQKAAANSPYNVTAFSGFRKGDPRQHGHGNATDVKLIDPKTGAALANYQDPSTFKAYQNYANAVYNAATPEQRQALRWGGYFSGGKGKYGALDLMHFDINSGIGMAGGSFQGGLTPAQAKIWGISPGGGISGAPAAPPPVNAGPQGATEAANPATWNAAASAKEDAPTELPAGVQGPPNPPGWAPPGQPSPSPADTAVAARDATTGLDKKGWRNTLAHLASGFRMPEMAKNDTTLAGMAMPGAARIDTPEMPTFDPNQVAQQRQNLAFAMQRLNSGRLF